MTDSSILFASVLFLILLVVTIYLYLKLKDIITREIALKTEEIARVNDRITQDTEIINGRIEHTEIRNSALNIYINNLINKLDELLQKPNDIYIFAEKRNTNSKNKINKIEREKPDVFFEELIESIDFRGYDENIRTQSKFLNYFRNCEKVLDIGCGNGDFLELCKINNIHAIGIDTSKKAIDSCLKRKLDAEQADVFEYLSRNDTVFDGVFCSHLIEHLNPNEVVTLFVMLNNRLQENGKLLILTPNVESFETQTIHFWRDLTHVRFYQKDVLVKLLELIGFEIIEAKFDEDTKGIKLFEAKWVV